MESLTSHPFYGLRTQMLMHLNSVGYPRIVPNPHLCFGFLLVFMSDMHLEPGSEKQVKILFKMFSFFRQIIT